MSKEEITARLQAAQQAVAAIQTELDEFDSKAENNVFASLDEARYKVEDMLGGRAFQDCEGAHNCGQEEYTQLFMVDGVTYKGVLKCEYNRHDKMYYYVDGSEFSYAAV